MTRLFADGLSIEVKLNNTDQPAYFVWRRQSHQVNQIINHWRINTAWWGQQQYRDYYRMTTTQGWLVEIFCDRLTDEWYLQRIYD